MIYTQTIICQEGFRNVFSNILKPQEANRKVEQKQGIGQGEGKEKSWVKSRHRQDPQIRLCGILFFQSFLLIRSRIDDAPFAPRRVNEVRWPLYCNVYTRSCSALSGFVFSISLLSVSFSIFIKFKWREILFISLYRT